MGNLLEFIKSQKRIQKLKRGNAPYRVQFYDFWEQEVTDMWLYRFIDSHRLLGNSRKKICFFSTFGNRDDVENIRGDVKVFFSGENLKRGTFGKFSDHLLNNEKVDLALGFEYFEEVRYLRFPLWLLYMFDPESREDDIVKRCKSLDRPAVKRRPRFACHISSEDTLGLRKKMCEEISQIAKVDCSGKVMHNCDDLWDVYDDDKMKFLSEYKFNICPENSNCYGYVTEKVFQAVDAGCVPIYWGSFNNPEPEVLNQQAILFWNKDGDNNKNLEFIRQLNESEKLYEEFSSQKRLVQNAAEYVICKFDDLESKLRELI